MADNTNAATRIAEPIQLPVRPKETAPRKPVVVRKRKKSRQKRMQEMIQTATHSAKIVAVCVCLLTMLTILIFQRAKLTMLNNEQYRLNTQLSDLKSETVRMEAEFNSMASVDSIEEYARTKLGMVKRQNSLVRFFENDGTDEIIIVGAMGE